MGKRIDLIGRSFGRLTVVAYSHTGSRRAYWKCVCECGSECVVLSSNLKSSHTTSCGCYQREFTALRSTTHGMKSYSEYNIWQGMIQRCNNIKNPDYLRYGGRSVAVCSEWSSFEQFYKDMGPRPSKDHTLDRKDNNGNYCNENCRWATRKEQNNNRRSSKMLTYKGENRTLAQWAELQGIAYATLYRRLLTGWSVEDALSIPTQKRGQR